MSRTSIATAIIVATGVCLAGCSRAPVVKEGVATDGGVAAIALPEEQLRFMLGRTVMGTQSGPMAMYVLGFDRGCQVFEGAIDRAVEKHLPQWRANLVQAYRNNVPADELARAVETSPKRAREQLGRQLPAIASDMQSASGSLLAQAGTEVLSKMSKEAGKVDPASIDQSQRQEDLTRMKTEGKICGVGGQQESE